MAITITKEPSGIYPAYNDSFIEFTSSLANNNRAEITIYPTATFPNVILLYPDEDGKYLFNLKEVMKVRFNEDGFNDQNYFTDADYKSITGNYIEQEIDIDVFNDSTSDITLTKDYTFYKSVLQVGRTIPANLYGLLSYSEDDSTYYLTYFKGFPFSFDLRRIEPDENTEIEVENVTAADSSVPLTDAELANGALRMNVDRGDGDSWNNTGFLDIIEAVNKLHILDEEIIRSVVYLDVRNVCSGVYLKWFNSQGGFSYYLFQQYKIESVGGQDLGYILNSDFNNIEDSIGFVKSTGKQSSRTFVIKARYNANEFEILKDLLYSPSIQLYTSTEQDADADFIDVTVEGTLRNSNKRGNNEIILTVVLPEIVTAKL